MKKSFDFVTGETQEAAIAAAKSRRWRKYTVSYNKYLGCWFAAHTVWKR